MWLENPGDGGAPLRHRNSIVAGRETRKHENSVRWSGPAAAAREKPVALEGELDATGRP
jgi:hypothetical protein